LRNISKEEKKENKMKLRVGTIIFCVLYCVVLLDGNCLPKTTTTTQIQTQDQETYTTPQMIFDNCETLFGSCSCGIYTEDCQCQCTTIHESAETTVLMMLTMVLMKT
jgi:hypothetical protein